MKAAVVERYGAPDVVRIIDMPTPEPKDNEILIGVHAATVSSGDWRLRSASFPDGMGLLARLALGVFRPRQPILGNDLSGVVVRAGAGVSRYKAGDNVIAQHGGTHAEFVAIPESGAVARMPEGLSFKQAAAMGFGGGTALHFLKKAGIQPGDMLLINGASGSVGTAMIELGKHFGAHVTAVCSGANEELVRRLGADEVIDYTTHDFADGKTRYDVIADTAGTAPYARAKPALKPGGRLLVILGNGLALLGLVRPDRALGHKIIGGVAAESHANLLELTEIAEAGHFTPVIDSEFQFDDIVAAHRRVETGRKRGNVVVTIAE